MDTGAQVSLVEDEWVKSRFPGKRVRALSELLEQELVVTSASGNSLGVKGWIEVELTAGDMKEPLKVPFIVTTTELDRPILGFNVITHVLRTTSNVSSLFQMKDPKKLQSLVQLLSHGEGGGEIGMARTGKGNVVIEPGGCKTLKCFVRSGVARGGEIANFSPAGFLERVEGVEIPESFVKLSQGSVCSISVPVKNRSSRPLYIRKGTHVGNLISVRSVVTLRPPETYPKPSVSMCSAKSENISGASTSVSVDQSGQGPESGGDLWDPDVGLDEELLTTEQVSQVRAMLREECHAFSRNDDDVGCVPDLVLDLTLLDRGPVRQPYRSMPPPLYSEVKDYVVDLLNKGWIRKSSSNYSSPMVAVRKKDGTLRLCIDYRALNRKTLESQRPVPRIQDVIDKLIGKRWFSTLDQGKAYHQGFMSPESRHLTAFCTPWSLYEWIRIPFGLSIVVELSRPSWKRSFGTYETKHVSHIWMMF